MSAPTPNVRQRRALRALTGSASYAAHAALPIEQATLAELRWQQERAAHHAMLHQADALRRRVRAAGEVGCAALEAVPTPAPSRSDRAVAALWRMHDRSLSIWLALALAVLAVDAALLAGAIGWWQP